VTVLYTFRLYNLRVLVGCGFQKKYPEVVEHLGYKPEQQPPLSDASVITIGKGSQNGLVQIDGLCIRSAIFYK